MERVYLILGSSAAVSERLSRTRGNGLPVNYWLILALGLVAFLTGSKLWESVVNSRGMPAEVSVGKVVAADGGMEDRYVRTRGEFMLDAGLSLTKKDKPEEAEKLYLPIVDKASHGAVFVELDPDPAKKPADMDARHVSGMVRKMDSRLKEELGMTTQQAGGIPIDKEKMIVAGDRPARWWIWGPICAVVWGLVGLMVVPVAQRYVVFRRMGAPVESGTEAGATTAGVVRVTGRFSLGPKVRQRFHNMPAVIAELEGGMMGLVTKTDASVRFMGTVTQERAGMWLIPIRGGTLTEPEFGRYYFGGEGLTAMRIRYVDDGTGRKEWAILAFESVSEMKEAREALSQTHGPEAAVAASQGGA